jgi:hypothetical protein
VIAVDAAGAAAESSELASLADRLYRVSYEPPFERYLPWLHSLCNGDWVLRLDGDEIASAALAEALPELTNERRVLQYRVPRRWLFGDPGRWLAEDPWFPDHQIRLVRNDPATLRFRGTLHSSAEPVLPARFIGEPIYHLTLLVASDDDRERRVRDYEALDSSMRVDNRRFYLPDADRRHVLRDTPPADRALIERVLSCAPGAAGERSAGLDASLEDVDRLWAYRDFDPGGYRVELACLEPEPTFVIGAQRDVEVSIRNLGTETIPWGGAQPNIRAAYHWLDTEGNVIVYDGHRTVLTSDLGPGDVSLLPLHVVPPAKPGSYLLELDLVHEGVRWFDCTTRVEARVAAPRAFDAEARAPAADGTRVVCVTGVHRSGTSLVARILARLGVYLGETADFVAPARDNPQGFFERRDIVALNDELLSRNGGSAIDPPRLEPGWERAPALDPLRREAAALIEGWTTGRALVGWKDPRTSLTLPFWRTLLPVELTLLVIRHPLEVASSLAARDGIATDHGSRLFVAYVVSALQSDPDAVIVRYQDLFDEPRVQVERLAALLGVTPEPVQVEEAAAFVDAGLRNGRFEALPGEGDSAVAVAVYRLLADGHRGVVLQLADRLLEWARGERAEAAAVIASAADEREADGGGPLGIARAVARLRR